MEYPIVPLIISLNWLKGFVPKFLEKVERNENQFQVSKAKTLLEKSLKS